ncbi:DUF2637 domain-containing protein [Streptomyces hirsutus]|uniref:DUF2637 domain-containing protein n=1 Tax=Streptomyces hirsutus TaxID=35620 RepID=UPI00333447DC
MSKQWFSRARKGNKPKPSKPLNESGVPPLTRWERFGAALTVLGGVAVGALGFYASFDGVSTKAAEWGFDDPWVLPTAIDSAIPVFTVAHLLLIRLDMPLWWARLVPWALSLVTCALNVAAGTSFWSKVAHGAMSLLWVAVSEIAAHIYAARIGAATGRRRRLDKIRWKRWLYSPMPTFLLHRRMILWEVASYDTALQLEQERLVYEAQLRGRFGRNWRRKAPVEALLPLRLARNGIPLAETAPAGLAAAGIDQFGLPGALPVQPAAAELEAPKSAPVPAAAARKPRAQVTASVPHQPEAPKQEPGSAPQPAPAKETIAEGGSTTAPLTEEELYEMMVAALEAGEGHRFRPNGDLTGAGMGQLLHQSGGNGRKVRARLLNRYAAYLSNRGVDVPESFTVEDLMTTTKV